jgi:hypothetical protein
MAAVRCATFKTVKKSPFDPLVSFRGKDANCRYARFGGQPHQVNVNGVNTGYSPDNMATGDKL